MPLPILYVEGKDDISVVSNLLRRHGIDTKRGESHLKIQDKGNVESVIDFMPEAIRANTERAVGFVVDIDVNIANRWGVLQDKVQQAGSAPPGQCPDTGFIGSLPDYPKPFGIWLMPDCTSDGGKLEHLIQTLLPTNDPLWEHAKSSTAKATEIIDWVNGECLASGIRWERFRDIDTIKAQIHTWLAWQLTPGAQLGAAINDHILGCDSLTALSFLRWLRELYGFHELAHL